MKVIFDKELHHLPIDPYPEAYDQIGLLISKLSKNDKNYILNDSSRIEMFLTEITPFALLLSFGNIVSPDFWISYAHDNYSKQTITDELLTKCDEIPIFEVSYNNDSPLGKVDPPILSELSIDPLQILQDVSSDFSSILIPEGTDITIQYMNQASTELILEKEDKFEFRIYSSRIFDGVRPNLPAGHPLTGVDYQNRDLMTVPAGLSLECEFSFPDEPDSNISQHYAFGEGWSKLLNEYWDIEKIYNDEMTHLHRLERKIDTINSKLSSTTTFDED